MQSTISLLVTAFVFPALYAVLHYSYQKEFTVHPTGLVLISGASTGIGRHAAEQLAQEGYKVFCGVRKEKDIVDIADMQNNNMVPVLLDVTQHETILSTMKLIQEELSKTKLPFVALVNNAGISRRMVAEFHELADIQKVFNTNVFGMMDLTQQSLPFLRQSQGRIVMISSVNGKIGTPMSSTYVASKFAMEGYSDSLRREVSAHGISVSIVEPGYVKSSIFATNQVAIDKMMAEDNELSVKTAAIYPDLYSEASAKKRRDGIALAAEPTVTSDAISHAVRAQYPKTRYVVATSGKLSATMAVFLTWIFPDRVIDALM